MTGQLAGRVAGLVLAAGGSRRLGEAKQLVVDGTGRSLVANSAWQLLDAGCDPVLVVVGAHADQVVAALSQIPVTIRVNDEWAEGMGSSIRCGVRALLSLGGADAMDAVLITTCDMPAVTAEHLRGLMVHGAPAVSGATEGWHRVGSAYLSQPEGTGPRRRVRGVPALFPSRDWHALAALTGERGAKTLVERPDTVMVTIGDDHFDIDTPSDLASWRNRPASP